VDLGGSIDLIASDLPRAVDKAAASPATVAAVSKFSADLFASLARLKAGNVVCSPYSVAVALGATVQGARGATAAQMLEVLHSTDAGALADGLNAIDAALAARSMQLPGRNGDEPRYVQLASANSLWGQQGVTWQRPFLDVLARDFGTGMRVVDYGQAEAAANAINAWVSEQTHARIPELIAAGVLSGDTVLTLVNAIYFKAPWQKPFKPRMTREAPFHRLGGSTVSTQMMDGPTGDRFASGPGWVAADLPYAGGGLAMAVVVPDTGRFAEVERSLTGELLVDLLTGLQPTPVQIGLPRWTDRTQVDLSDALAGLGMPIAFTKGADFSAMTMDEQLWIYAVAHQGFIAVDEAGTEAAAATAVMTEAVSKPAPPPVSVVADRPFLYVIHDRPTGLPLFIGRVLEPTAR